MKFLRSTPQLVITVRTVSAAVTTVYWRNSQFCSTFSHSMTKPLAVGTGGNRLHPALFHYFTNYLIASLRFIPITTLTTSSEFVMRLSSILRFPFMSWTHTARCFETLAATWTYIANNAAVRYSKTTTYNTVSWLKKPQNGGGGISCSALRMSDGTEHYEKQFVRSEKWRQFNRRGRGSRGNLFTTTVSRKMNRAVMNREWMGGDTIVQVSVCVCVCVCVYVCVCVCVCV